MAKKFGIISYQEVEASLYDNIFTDLTMRAGQDYDFHDYVELIGWIVFFILASCLIWDVIVEISSIHLVRMYKRKKKMHDN